MKYLKLYNESILSNLMSKDKIREYKFLGDTNSKEWEDNLTEILNNYKYLPMLESDKSEISEMFEQNPKLYQDIKKNLIDKNPVEYPTLNRTKNSRFSYCWFLGKIDREPYHDYSMSWDISIQYFEGEYFLVKIGSNYATFDYWYWCDQFGGLQRLIKDKF